MLGSLQHSHIEGTGLGLVRLYKEQCKSWTAFNSIDFPHLNLAFVKAL